FRRAVEVEPRSGRSWLGLVQLGDATESDRRRMEARAAEGPFEDEEDRAALENALGLLDERRGDYAGAFAHFESSTAIVRGQRAYSKQDNEQSAEIAASWSRPDCENPDHQREPQHRKPIFVTGLARSGTTLVQEILAAHTAVNGGAEFGLAMQVEAMVGGFAPADF